MSASIIEQLVEQVEDLPDELQYRVLEFAQSLASSEQREAAGKDLLWLAGTISLEDLQIMSEVIEQESEQVNLDEW
jgi:hypothetical protein